MSLTDEIRLLALEKAVDAAFPSGNDFKCSVSFVDCRDDALVERRAHHSEGDARRTLTIRGAWEGEQPSAAALSLVEAEGRHLRDLVDRDRAIAAAGRHERQPPEWAFIVQTMAETIMRNEGRDPLDLVRLDPTMRTRTGIRTRVRGPDDGAADEEFDGLACGAMATLNRRCAEWHYQDAAGPVLGLRTVMPHTLAQAIAGEMLDDVVQDQRLAGSGLRIARTHVQPTGAVVLVLEKAWRPLAEAPPGIDTSWRRPREAGVAVPTI